MVEGLALTAAEVIEALSTYAATDQTVPAVTTTPGWHVVGAFRMRISFDVRLAALASVSLGGLTLNARLFDLITNTPVSGVVTITSLVDLYAESAAMSLVGGHSYQMQVEVVGNSGVQYFGTVRNVQLVTA